MRFTQDGKAISTFLLYDTEEGEYDQRDNILKSEETEELQKEFVQKTHEDIKQRIHDIISKQIDGPKSMKQDKTDFLENIIKEYGLNLDEKLAKKLDTTNWKDSLRDDELTVTKQQHSNVLNVIEATIERIKSFV